ncbi:MAG: hypothetical protein ACREMR_07215 [Gemmatimonadales bacterium]
MKQRRLGHRAWVVAAALLALGGVPAGAQLKAYGVNAALAQRPSDAVIFYITRQAGNDSVFTWDPAVPAATPVFIGRTGAGIPYLPRLAFSQSGTLYAVNTGTTQLYTINQTTDGAAATGAPLTGGGSMAANGATSTITLTVAVGAAVFLAGTRPAQARPQWTLPGGPCSQSGRAELT